MKFNPKDPAHILVCAGSGLWHVVLFVHITIAKKKSERAKISKVRRQTLNAQ